MDGVDEGFVGFLVWLKGGETRGKRKRMRMSVRVRTFDRNGENGRPPSLAKDHICREAVAISLMTAQTRVMIMMATMISVPTRLFVML